MNSDPNLNPTAILLPYVAIADRPCFIGSDGRDRTYDQLINRHLNIVCNQTYWDLVGCRFACRQPNSVKTIHPPKGLTNE